MKHNAKQFVAWSLAVGLSGSIYGGGAYWLKSNGHAALSEHNGDHSAQTHDAPAHVNEHQVANHSSEHPDEHGGSYAAENAPHHETSPSKDDHNQVAAHEEHAEKKHEVAAHEEHAEKKHEVAAHEENAEKKHEVAAHEENAEKKHVVASNKTEHPSQSTAAAHDDHKPHWTYDKKDAAGPNNWGDLAEQFSQCEKGLTQSPVDLRGEVASGHAPKLVWQYGSSNVSLENNGHTIQTSIKSGSNTLTIDGEVYTLAQFHFHNPSEHKIAGTPSDLEMHFVHKNKSGGLAVVGVMINERSGKENITFKPIWDRLPRDQSSNTSDVIAMKVSSLLPAKREYLHYSGSLTTPPCSEGVKWFVLKEPLTMSGGQVEMYSSIFGGPTNRPVQPLQGREIIANSPAGLAH